VNAEIVRFIRKTNDLSVREFATKINVSHSLISRIEGGDRRITDKIRRRIVETFGLTDEKLMAIKLLINEIKN
jgi:transcriptional regulator with XRE-family HTH domain